jgi:hypothetical protein
MYILSCTFNFNGWFFDVHVSSRDIFQWVCMYYMFSRDIFQWVYVCRMFPPWRWDVCEKKMYYDTRYGNF